MLLSMTVTTVTKIFKIIARQYHPAKYLHINGLVYILYIYISHIYYIYIIYIYILYIYENKDDSTYIVHTNNLT